MPTRSRRRPGPIAESWIHVDLGSRVPAGLEADVTEVLHDVREVVRDAPAMARQARALADRLLADGLLGADRSAGSSSVTRADDLANLLRWLAEHRLVNGPTRASEHDAESARAVREALRELLRANRVPKRSAPRPSTPHPSCSCSPAPARRAACCGPVQPYHLAVRIVDATGKLLGEHRFLGMLTVAALFENVLDIPVVERHVQ
jgi:glutamate dehydrogenase